jgi:hypothetical protein
MDSSTQMDTWYPVVQYQHPGPRARPARSCFIKGQFSVMTEQPDSECQASSRWSSTGGITPHPHAVSFPPLWDRLVHMAKRED